MRFKRRARGFFGLEVIAIPMIIVWSCALAFQVWFTRQTKNQRVNYHDTRYRDKGTLHVYFFFCFADALYHSFPSSGLLDNGRDR